MKNAHILVLKIYTAAFVKTFQLTAKPCIRLLSRQESFLISPCKEEFSILFETLVQ